MPHLVLCELIVRGLECFARISIKSCISKWVVNFIIETVVVSHCCMALHVDTTSMPHNKYHFGWNKMRVKWLCLGTILGWSDCVYGSFWKSQILTNYHSSLPCSYLFLLPLNPFSYFPLSSSTISHFLLSPSFLSLHIYLILLSLLFFFLNFLSHLHLSSYYVSLFPLFIFLLTLLLNYLPIILLFYIISLLKGN